MARKTTTAKAVPRPMLRWFEVENFKSIKKLRLEFKPFMVFVGPNGAGKTNLLQALALLLDLSNRGDESTVEQYGGTDQLLRRGARKASYVRLEFGAEPLREPGAPAAMGLEFRLTAKGVHGVVNLDAGKSLGKTQSQKHLNWFALKIKRDEQILPSPAIRLRLDASALRSDVTGGRLQGGLLGISGDGLPRAVERVRDTPAFKRILAGLQAVYPRIEDVDTVQLLPGEVAIRFKERSIKDGLGQANVSDGVMHALALLIVLEASPPDTVLLIEEPENALHPWALRTILKRVQDNPRQAPVLLATHSPTLIDAVEDPSALFIVENDDKKGTTVTPALTREKALRAILAESGQKLGDIWLDGLLGGVPDGDV